MTAVLMARLVERGLLEWHTPVTPLFAERGIGVHRDFASLTLRHLLAHTSGMDTDPTPEELDLSYHSRSTPRQQREALARGAMTRRPTGKPSEVCTYSNLGYAIAGVLAETVTDMAWEDLMRREVFSSLGLKSAGFGAPGRSSSDELSQPWGHQVTEDGLTAIPPDDLVADNPPIIGPAGTIHLSLPDFARYLAFHVSRGATAPGYLSQETMDYLHSPKPEEESGAFGWFLAGPEENRLGQSMLWHDGSNVAWYALALMLPEDQRGLALVSNAYQDLMVDPEHGAIAALEEIYTNWASPAVA
jgi:CubicO group peptidase (beta-lactamase class C family)